MQEVPTPRIIKNHKIRRWMHTRRLAWMQQPWQSHTKTKLWEYAKNVQFVQSPPTCFCIGFPLPLTLLRFLPRRVHSINTNRFWEMFHLPCPLLGCWEWGPHLCYHDLLESFSESIKTLLKGVKENMAGFKLQIVNPVKRHCATLESTWSNSGKAG